MQWRLLWRSEVFRRQAHCLMASTIRESFSGASWQRCDVIDSYAKRFPKAVQCLEDELEDSLAFYAFPMLDARKISSSNMIERLNREIRRRTSVIGIFPNESSYVRLVTAYLMEYAEDWSVSRAYISHESIAATVA